MVYGNNLTCLALCPVRSGITLYAIFAMPSTSCTYFTLKILLNKTPLPKNPSGIRLYELQSFNQRKNIETHIPPITKVLKIKQPYIDWILEGKKTWEMRSTTCKIREIIALAPSGSSEIIGVVRIIDCVYIADTDDINNYYDKHRVDRATWLLDDFVKYRYAWVLSEATRLISPIPYSHKNGAVKFAKLDESVSNKLSKAIVFL